MAELRSWMNETQAKRFEAGLCVRCGNAPITSGAIRCRGCLDHRNKVGKKHFKKKKDQKRCKQCGNDLGIGGTKILCASCRENQNTRMRKYYFDLKIRTIEAYGGHCKCCGEQNVMFLCVDHVKNDGYQHRKEMEGKHLYIWLEKRGFPQDDFQLLCYNCNMGKRLNKGVCPHKGICNG